MDREFWLDLEDLMEVIKPLHQNQLMSESGRAHLGYVLSRWKQIYQHLYGLSNRPGFKPAPYLLRLFTDRPMATSIQPSLWKARFERQITDIHRIAYHLDPANYAEEVSPEDAAAIRRILDQYLDGNPEEKAEDRNHFLDFKQQTNTFSIANEVWLDMNNPSSFWSCAKIQTPRLGGLATRIFNTAANSVPSERAFSAMNFIHSRIRNRLKTDRADMLLFIYMNIRALRPSMRKPMSSTPLNKPPYELKKPEKTSLLTMTEEEELSMEEEGRNLQEASTSILGKRDREDDAPWLPPMEVI